MAEAAPLTYYILPLTKEETLKGGPSFGLKSVMEKKDRWVNVDYASYEMQTYDRGYTTVVYQNKLYFFQRDFILLDTKERVFLLVTRDSELDKIEDMNEDSNDSTEESTEGTITAETNNAVENSSLNNTESE